MSTYRINYTHRDAEGFVRHEVLKDGVVLVENQLYTYCLDWCERNIKRGDFYEESNKGTMYHCSSQKQFFGSLRKCRNSRISRQSNIFHVYAIKNGVIVYSKMFTSYKKAEKKYYKMFNKYSRNKEHKKTKVYLLLGNRGDVNK